MRFQTISNCIRISTNDTSRPACQLLYSMDFFIVVRRHLFQLFVCPRNLLKQSGLIPSEPYWANTSGGHSAHELKLQVFCFFIVQIPALAVERLVAEIAVGVMGSPFWEHDFGFKLRGVINFIWVKCWFMLCTPFVGSVTRQLGAFRMSPVPFSIVEWALSRK